MQAADAARITRLAALAAVGVAAGLIGLKAWAWAATGSVSMLSALADSALDLVASLFTFAAVRYAATPPDDEHRYGHGKAEAFAGLFQAGVVAVSAVLIGIEAVRRLLNPEALTRPEIALWVSVVAIIATSGLVAFQSWALRQTGSVATEGDRAHYLTDLGSNVAVMVGVAASAWFGLVQADALVGLLLAAWLGHGAWKVAKGAGHHLMDRELPDEARARILELARTVPGVINVHGLRTRASGPYVHMQAHVDLDPGLSLRAAHDIVVAIETAILAEFPAADIILHPDPADAAPHGLTEFGDGRLAAS
jgi:ferrous-iron efflux pump FieF